MDCRVLIVSLLCCLGYFLGPSPAKADVNDELDQLATLLYQFPATAEQQLQQRQNQGTYSPLQLLKLHLLQCQTQLQLGDNDAAIKSAQAGATQARRLRIEEAVPYFQICEADAHNNRDDISKALSILDNVILDAKKFAQPQAMVGALRLKGQVEIDIGSYSAAIEDLRLALDIYPDTTNQANNWMWTPKSYIYADMGSLFHVMGDLPQATYYLNLALKEDTPIGKMRHVLLLMLARVTFDIGEISKSQDYLTKSKTLLSAVASPLELATSYVQIGALEMLQGHLSDAETWIDQADQIYQKAGIALHLMRINRLLASLRAAQGNFPEALEKIDQSIELAAANAQYDDLVRAEELKAGIFAKQKQFKDAYQAMQRAAAANEQAQGKLNNAQFMQYKAKLALQEQQQNLAQQQIRALSTHQQSNQEKFYIVIGLLLLVILTLATWLLLRKRDWTFTTTLSSASQEQQADVMILNAKRANQPLSVLLLDIRHVRQIDLPTLQEDLLQQLREQDKLLSYSMDELLVLLPYTSAVGAERVAQQLTPILHRWQGSKSPIGLATLKQPDNLQSLVTRASVNQLGRSLGDEAQAPVTR